MKYKIVFLVSIFCIGISSCESDIEKKERLAREESNRIILEEKRKAEEIAHLLQLEQERLEREQREEKARREKVIYEKYINNSLRTGATPYSRNFGGNSSCNEYGCSQLTVRTSNSDVIVTVKRNDKVVRHAYIKSSNSYTFSIPVGTYQTFFYYGRGWNPEKLMKGGEIVGGFIENESFSKDDPQYLNNNILEYELILQRNGNFSTRLSNQEEAF